MGVFARYGLPPPIFIRAIYLISKNKPASGFFVLRLVLVFYSVELSVGSGVSEV